MISDTLISPRADQNIRKRSVEYKRRIGSPNFRDILRQRCRERVKARRGFLFDQLRALESEESVRNALTQYIENDLKDLQSSCILSEKDDKESMDFTEDQPLSQLAVSDREKWILEEYDRLIENTNAQADLASVVACPLCGLGTLYADVPKAVVCCSQCSLLLPHSRPLPQLEALIIQAVDQHELFCSQTPQFTVCPDTFTNNLLLLCATCGDVQQIV